MTERLLNWILEICNASLFGEGYRWDERELPDTDEMNQLIELSGAHGMLSVVMHGIQNIAIQDEELRDIIITGYGTAEKAERGIKKRLALMKYLSTEFKKAGLDVMFLKGATLAQFYPISQWRVFSDIDFYLYGRYDEGVKVLEQMGIETEEGLHHHSTSSYSDILLENHYDFIDRANHKCNLLIDDELKKLAEKEGRDYPYTFDNTEIDNAYCMSPTMNAIFLIRHMSTHFVSETVPLRMLYDWVLFLKRCTKDVDWDKVLSLYEQSGLSMFARMIQGILVSKMGIAIPDCPIEPLLEEKTDRIWNSIIDGETHNPYKKNSLLYTLYEVRVFIKNRWKHRIVFPKESYLKLFFSYVFLHLKSKLTRLFHSE